MLIGIFVIMLASMVKLVVLVVLVVLILQENDLIFFIRTFLLMFFRHNLICQQDIVTLKK